MKNFFKILTLFFAFLVTNNLFSQLSKIHYIPPLTHERSGNNFDTNAPEDQWFYISTPSVSDVPFTIKRANGDIMYSAVVSNANPWIDRAAPSGVEYGYLFIRREETESRGNLAGFIIEAESDIYVSVRFNSNATNGGNQYHAGALVSKGDSGFGTRFRAGALQNQTGAHMNFASIMATENNTKVSITVPQDVELLSGATGTIQVTLDYGQTYVVAAEQNNTLNSREGIIGTLIESDKSIVVNSGSGTGSFTADEGGQDYGIDQIVGRELVGNEYIFIRGEGDDGWENVLLIADQDNTRINVNGLPLLDDNNNQVVLDNGEFVIIEGDKYHPDRGNMYVNSSNPDDKIFAFQGLGAIWTGQNNQNRAARQGMFFVPPLSCANVGDVDNIAQINFVGKEFEDGGAVTFVAKKDSAVTINGNPINQFQTEGPYIVDGNPNYETYLVKNLEGNITVRGDDELYVAYYNTNYSATTGGFYSGFARPPTFDLNVEFESLGSCIKSDGSSNVTITATNFSNFDSIVWQKLNELTGNFEATNSTTAEFTPNQPGVYRLKGVLECTNIDYVSDEIPISICPDDFDNDGIIDNIDLDIDNDGISNFYESLGDGKISFQDPLNPEITLLDGTRVPGVITGTIASSRDDHAVSNGGVESSFESQVEAGVDQTLTYTLEFNEKLNILFKDSNIDVAAIDGESFVLKSLPSTTNITLLDPDDNLLVDTDFDGIYEDETLEYTSNEIRFKFKTRTDLTYEFYSYQIDGLSLTHNYSNVNATGESVYVPVVNIKDYNLNTDSSDELDMYDYDSDNDGCFDVIEAGYVDGDGDGIFGEGIPTIDNGGVTSRGQIVFPDYDPSAEPAKDNADNYYFQKVGEPPVISTQPQSAIACEVGSSVEFKVGVTTNDNTIYSWFYATSSGPNNWIKIEDNTQYSGSNTDTLTISDVQIEMDGNKYRVEVSTDEYACIQTTNDDTTLIVEESLPTANQVDDVLLCDDNTVGNDTDGLIGTFDFTNLISKILGDDQSNEDFTVTFHLSQDDADDINNSGISFPFSNTVAFSQPIHVRVLSNKTECFNSDMIFNALVAPLPVLINSNIVVEQCDDDDNNDGRTLFNLTEFEDDISENHENETFEYYTDSSFSDDSLIENPNSYENETLFNQIIYVKVLTENNCFRTAQIELKIGASAIDENFLLKFSACETSPSNEQDGIESWDSSIFNEITNQLIASDSKFSGQNITILYFNNKEDALTKNNPIDTNISYTNITPFLQDIWVSVEINELNTISCLGLKKVAELYIEPRPIAYPVSIDRQCDGSQGDDSQDGLYTFDTSSVIDQLLTDPATGVKQDESVLTVTYFSEDGSEILAADFSPNFLTASQTITIRVEIDPSYPEILNPDGLCYDETTLEFIVDNTPEAYPVTVAPKCDGEDGYDDNDGFNEFDTSNITATLLGSDQSLDDYTVTYQYVDEAGNLLSSNELRNPFNTQTQTVTATITNNLNPSCPATMDIEFVVNPLPTFTVDDDALVCLNLDPIPIGVTSAEGNYTYTWTHTYNGVNSPFPTSGPTIFIGVGGIYYVTATDVDTGCQRTLSIFVEESEIASFDLNDDGTVSEDEYDHFIDVSDITDDNNNKVRIKNVEDLGIGDYEFALYDPAGPYQVDQLFENVRPGIHKLYIRDKRGCGIYEIDISVIGYKKFLTPNGDGIHDTWRILGINEFFQPNSKIYVFDRYGKLIKELDPRGTGWDGTFSGRPMPQSDYWFRVFLEDGREFKGHFSLVRGK